MCWASGSSRPKGRSSGSKCSTSCKTRGVNDILIAVVDGLKGLGEAIETRIPANHGADLHRAPDPQQPGLHELEGSQGGLRGAAPDLHRGDREAADRGAGGVRSRDLGREVPDHRAVLAAAWECVIPFFAFPPAVRKVIYTTNAIESLNMQLRKIIKTRGHFPNDEAATKLLWLALRNILAGRVPSIYEWKDAMNQFAVLYGDRFTIREI